MTWLLIAEEDKTAGIRPPRSSAVVDRPSTALIALQLNSLAARASCRAAQSFGERIGCA
jgi:hypothetical protein